MGADYWHNFKIGCLAILCCFVNNLGLVSCFLFYSPNISVVCFSLCRWWTDEVSYISVPSQLVCVVRDINSIWLLPSSGMLSVFDSRYVISFKCSFMFIFGRLQNCRAAMGTVVASVIVVCLQCMKIVILEWGKLEPGMRTVVESSLSQPPVHHFLLSYQQAFSLSSNMYL